MAREHIHTPDDGRPPRTVYLNGKRVPSVFYADTRRGKLVRFRLPLKIHKYGGRLICKTEYGRVEVVEGLHDGA